MSWSAAAFLLVTGQLLTACAQNVEAVDLHAASPTAPRTLGFSPRDPGLPTLPRRSDLRYGLTLDSLDGLDAMLVVLRSLPRRLTVRVVFDLAAPPSAYLPAVTALAKHADVMGELLDSSDVASLSISAYAARARSYVGGLGDAVAIWEIGNEVNGEWLGTSADVVAKVSAAYDVAKGAGKVTALTAYFNPNCWSRRDHEMLPWLSAQVPDRMTSGLDYVLVSYYEADCDNYRPASWTPLFGALAAMFPNASVGFGEVGMSKAVTATTLTRGKALLAYYYGIRTGVPRYVGGWFWWFGAQDVLGGSRPLLADFRAAIG